MPVVAATHLALSAAQVRKPCTSKDAVFGKVKRQLIFVPWLMAAISAYCSMTWRRNRRRAALCVGVRPSPSPHFRPVTMASRSLKSRVEWQMCPSNSTCVRSTSSAVIWPKALPSKTSSAVEMPPPVLSCASQTNSRSMFVSVSVSRRMCLCRCMASSSWTVR